MRENENSKDQESILRITPHTRGKQKFKDQRPRRCCEKSKKLEKSKYGGACPNEKKKKTKSRSKQKCLT
jgi:hypothetical protein